MFPPVGVASLRSSSVAGTSPFLAGSHDQAASAASHRVPLTWAALSSTKEHFIPQPPGEGEGPLIRPVAFTIIRSQQDSHVGVVLDKGGLPVQGCLGSDAAGFWVDSQPVGRVIPHQVPEGKVDPG